MAYTQNRISKMPMSGQVPVPPQTVDHSFLQGNMLGFDDIDFNDPDFFGDTSFLTETNTNPNGTEPFPDFVDHTASGGQSISAFISGSGNGNGNELFRNYNAGSNPLRSASYASTANVHPHPTASYSSTANAIPHPSASYFSMVNQFGFCPVDQFYPSMSMQPGVVNTGFNGLDPLDNVNGNFTPSADVGPFDNVVPYDPADEQFQPLEEVPSEHGDEEAEQFNDHVGSSDMNAGPVAENARSLHDEEQDEENIDDGADEHDSLSDDEATLVDAQSPQDDGDANLDGDDEIDDTVDYGEVNIDDRSDADDRVEHDELDPGDYDSYGTLTPPDGSIDEDSDDESDESKADEQEQTQDPAAPARLKARKSRKKDDPVYDDITHHLPALCNSPNLTTQQKANILACIPEHLVNAMYSYNRVPKSQSDVDDNMSEYTYRPQVPHLMTVPVSNAYPKYTGHFKTKEQAQSWRKRCRLPAKNQAPDVLRVKKYGRQFWVREIYNSMIDITDMSDSKASVHRARFLSTSFLAEDLESVAHHLFDSCIAVHERGFNRPQVYHKKAVRGKLKDVAEESIELRLSKLCACLRKSKASADDAIRGGVTLSLLCDNPAARAFTKASNNTGNQKRGERLRFVKEVEPKKAKIEKAKKVNVTKARKGKKGAVAAQQEGQNGAEGEQ